MSKYSTNRERISNNPFLLIPLVVVTIFSGVLIHTHGFSMAISEILQCFVLYDRLYADPDFARSTGYFLHEFQAEENLAGLAWEIQKRGLEQLIIIPMLIISIYGWKKILWDQ